jgi:hypothetical protein
MPLIVFQGMHGANDFPLHHSILEALERRKLLDRYDFAIDPSLDLDYCEALVRRFPQTRLALPDTLPSRLAAMVHKVSGKGQRLIANSRAGCDAICQAPGGGIHPDYTNGADQFWRYPKARRRAIVFHSLERGILDQPVTRASIAACDLVIARTATSAQVAIDAGVAKNAVVTSSDIVFCRDYKEAEYKPGIAAALRVDKASDNQAYFDHIKAILDYLEATGLPIDHTYIEKPMDEEQLRRGYGTEKMPMIAMHPKNAMYIPFELRRDAIISSRLHTTLLGLLAGNRKILQYQIEPNTNKINEILGDMGLSMIKVHGKGDVSKERIRQFVEEDAPLDAQLVQDAIANARARNEAALDRFEEWLGKL